MAHTRLHTGFPRISAGLPHMAPVLGAQPLIHEPERGLEQALTDAEAPRSGDVRPDPWPEVAVGVGTAALSGGLTGGVAAGSWAGAGIGAGVTVAGWSAFTLFGSWRELGPKARAVLGTSLAVGGIGTAVGLYLRSRR